MIDRPDLLLFARIDFAIRRDDQLTPEESLTAALARAAVESERAAGESIDRDGRD